MGTKRTMSPDKTNVSRERRLPFNTPPFLDLYYEECLDSATSLQAELTRASVSSSDSASSDLADEVGSQARPLVIDDDLSSDADFSLDDDSHRDLESEHREEEFEEGAANDRRQHSPTATTLLGHGTIHGPISDDLNHVETATRSSSHDNDETESEQGRDQQLSVHDHVTSGLDTASTSSTASQSGSGLAEG
ncbi:MAG: hypothetical protein M4579_006774 [Chaenotheca gracillima]|nr:MAG: hypothetical protein M4579_006774 [Chaenotheca gracillima]